MSHLYMFTDQTWKLTTGHTGRSPMNILAPKQTAQTYKHFASTGQSKRQVRIISTKDVMRNRMYLYTRS